MDVSLLIRQQLGELGLDQKDLAAATHVTESYISQLLARKKAPPAPGRTAIYEKIGRFLHLPSGELSRLAGVQRQFELKKRVAESAAPLFQDCRELILRKCQAGSRGEVRRVFEKEPFGELERMVTQKILEVAQGVAREELRDEKWLRSMAKLSGRNFREMRAAIREFLDADMFHVSLENCVQFLEPMVDSWDIDLRTFAMDIALNQRLAPRAMKRFEFAEKAPDQTFVIEPGFEQFLKDKALSGDASEEEIEFLKTLRFKGERRPAPLYYYRELQNLRDPLHFRHCPWPSE